MYENVWTYKNKLYVREVKNGKLEIKEYNKDEYLPDIYIKDKGVKTSLEKTKLHPIDDISKRLLKLKTDNTLYKLVQEHKNKDDKNKYYGNLNIVTNYIRNYYKDMNLEKIPDFYNMWILDIETALVDNSYKKLDETMDLKTDWKPHKANAKVVSIQIYDYRSDKYIYMSLKKEYTNYDKEYIEELNKKYNLNLKIFEDVKKFFIAYNKKNNKNVGIPYKFNGKKLVFKKYDSEKVMLEEFFKLINTLQPTVITGYNIKGYDIPYLTNRLIKLNGYALYNKELQKEIKNLNIKTLEDIKKYKDKIENILGFEIDKILEDIDLLENEKVDKIKNILNNIIGYGGFDKRNINRIDLLKDIQCVYKEAKNDFGQTFITYDWKVTILEDYLDLFKKYINVELENNELDTVAEFILGRKKVEHKDFANYTDFYLGNLNSFLISNSNDKGLIEAYKKGDEITFERLSFNRFLEYGLVDIDLIKDMENKVKLIKLARFISYICGVTMNDVRGTVKQWNELMYSKYLEAGIVLPIKSIFLGNDVYNTFEKYVKKAFDKQTNSLGINIADDLSIQTFQGGFTKASGRKSQKVVSFDFSSLYPSIIMWANIGLDTLYIPKEDEVDLLEIKRKYAIFYPKNMSSKELALLDYDFIEKIKDKNIANEIKTVLHKYNLCMLPNGTFFKKDRRSIFAKVIENIIVTRYKYKNLKLLVESILINFEKNNLEECYKIIDENNLNLDKNSLNIDYIESYLMLYAIYDLAFKILANSAYGSLSLISNVFAGHSEYFGGAVTSGGRIANIISGQSVSILIDKIVSDSPSEIFMNKTTYLDNSVQIDTDSNYITLEKLFKNKVLKEDNYIDEIIKFSNKEALPKIYETLDYLGDVLNVYDKSKLKEDMEDISEDFLSIAPKLYIKKVVWADGETLPEPKIKAKGIAFVKKDTPRFFRNLLNPILEKLLETNVNNIIDFNNKVYEDMKKANIDDLVSFVRVNKLNYIYDKSENKFFTISELNGKKRKLTAPLNSTASLIYNNYVIKNNLNYPLIETGDKVMMIALKKPNPFYLNTIAFKTKDFRKEIEDFIDYEYIYKKYYLDKINLILDKVNVDISKKEVDFSEFL